MTMEYYAHVAELEYALSSEGSPRLGVVGSNPTVRTKQVVSRSGRNAMKCDQRIRHASIQGRRRVAAGDVWSVAVSVQLRGP